MPPFLEEFAGGQNPTLAHESFELSGQRNERDQIDKPQQTQKEPTGQNVGSGARSFLSLAQHRESQSSTPEPE